jgi:transcription initiation factor IIF auxiliary subunit
MRIAQDQHYHGGDWWTWSVWLDAAGDLDRVQKVTWHLHPTFADPVREQTNRHEKFKLTTSGWGAFKVRADIAMDDGTVVKLHHQLELTYPDGRPTPS